MLDRNGYIASGILHVGVVLLILLGLPNVFRHPLPEETPLVVQLVKLGPQTRATKLTKTPPVPEAKPEVAEDVPAPKPLPPAPEPPKIEPNPEPPQLMTPPDPQLATPEPPPPPAPQPKPLPTAPLPPVPAPKPEAPPQAKPVAVPVPQPKPQPPKPKVNQQAFNTLLKNLAKNNPAPNTTTNQPKTANPARRASSQPIAPLGSELTASELDLVKQQIYQCWNVPLGARDATDLTPEFRVSMNRDATVQSVVLLNTERYGDPTFRAAADSARRALFNPQCTPLKLPLDKYNEWQTFTITFDPKDVAG
jgi:hypothetical protein